MKTTETDIAEEAVAKELFMFRNSRGDLCWGGESSLTNGEKLFFDAAVRREQKLQAYQRAVERLKGAYGQEYAIKVITEELEAIP